MISSLVEFGDQALLMKMEGDIVVLFIHIDCSLDSSCQLARRVRFEERTIVISSVSLYGEIFPLLYDSEGSIAGSI